MKARTLALLLLILAIAAPGFLVLGRSQERRAGFIELRGRVAEAGGWSPENLTVGVGEPLNLHLTSDDVVHGFAVGQHSSPPIDLDPGKVVETTLTFTQPGKYVFYCTRWCGPGHWRMRGTIEVVGPGSAVQQASSPLYLDLGLDIDAPHPADPPPSERPSAARGASLQAALLLTDSRTQSPAAVWRLWRTMPESSGFSNSELWDLLAYRWRENTPGEALQQAARIYAADCAACHGLNGDGNGVMADSLSPDPSEHASGDHGLQKPVAFSDFQQLLGASPAVLQGKILRGGMGTGMPYFGPIYTEEQTWMLVDYLWSFAFDYSEAP